MRELPVGGMKLLVGLGGLVMATGNVESQLAVIATAGTEGAPRYLLRWTAEKLADRVAALAAGGAYGEHSAEVLDLVEPLRGETGLLRRRNRYVHSWWTLLPDGAIERRQLRRALYDNLPREGLTTFDEADLEALTRALAAKSDALRALVPKVWSTSAAR